MTILDTFSNLGFSFYSLFILAFLALIFSSFIKISTVLAIVRAGIGFRSLPGVLVSGSLAFTLSCFIMFPYFENISKEIDSNILNKASANISQNSSSQRSESVRLEALNIALSSWKKFLYKHSDPELIKEFSILASKVNKSSSKTSPSSGESENIEASLQVLAPSFYISELKEAFSTGLGLLLPFLIIDLCVAQVLIAIGVKNLDPLLVALPLKLLLFVALDGWTLIASNLIASYT